MSAAAEDEETLQRCASCGVAGSNDIKLMKCTACYLVKNCSVKCQKDHRKQHKKECKKRAAELHDELLFKQPESTHLGDCPICCLPLPIDPEKYTLNTCCSKRVCKGCNFANQMREFEGRLEPKCPFCRKVLIDTEDEEQIERLMKRVEANDPVAICRVATESYIKGDYNASFKYLTKAAALGDAHGHFQISALYREGRGVEKDENLALHHAEQAAIGRHHEARHNLGCFEWKNDQVDRAVKHWIIAAKLGAVKSLERLKTLLYKDGHVSKEDFESALRGHHSAIAATKSPQRDETAEYEMLRAER